MYVNCDYSTYVHTYVKHLHMPNKHTYRIQDSALYNSTNIFWICTFLGKSLHMNTYLDYSSIPGLSFLFNEGNYPTSIFLNQLIKLCNSLCYRANFHKHHQIIKKDIAHFTQMIFTEDSQKFGNSYFVKGYLNRFETIKAEISAIVQE